MHLLIPNGAQGDDHHIKAVKPAPAFNEMKAHCAAGREHQNGRGKNFQQAKAMEVQTLLRSPYILDQTRNLTRPNSMKLLGLRALVKFLSIRRPAVRDCGCGR